MPARIVVAHDGPEFRECAVAALQAAGYDITAFASSMETINALEAAERIGQAHVPVGSSASAPWRQA